MPRQRTSNASSKAPNKKQPNRSKQPRGAAHSSRAAERPGVVSASAWHDIAGVALVVVAVALGLSLVSPSEAVLADAARTFLTYGFGVGAMLVPCALLLYAVTFFVPDEEGAPVSARAALGLTLVVTAILGLLSASGAAPVTQDFSGVASAVFSDAWLTAHGGYWGGALAWLFLSLFGPVITTVVLVGLIVAGLVVCGLSISGIVARLRDARHEAAESFQQRRSERLAAQAAEPAPAAPTQVLQGRKAAGSRGRAGKDKDKTTYLGARKTTVLKREDAPAPGAKVHPPLEDLPTEATDELATPEVNLDLLNDDDWQAEAEGTAEGRSNDMPEHVADYAEVEDDVDEDVAAPLPVAAVGSADKPRERRRGNTKKAGATPPWMPVADPAGTEEAAAESAADIAAAAVAEEGGGAKLKAPKDLKRPGDASAAIELPPMSILHSNPTSAASSSSEAELRQTAERLQSTLEEFGLKSRVKGWVSGPLVTTFKIEMGEGERVNKITNLEDDIALSLAATSVRIFAPIPGTSLVGIEIPNSKRNNVCLGDVLPFADGGPLQVAVGRDSEGRPTVIDLAGLPHLLVAGTTGSGKSVMLNGCIMSILMRATPDQVRLIMVDPKRVEFTGYSGLPHLYVPVVNEPQKAASALQWAVTEMERRLKIFERAGARDIKSYNKMVADGKFADAAAPPDHMPYFVIVIDELADLMMVAGKDVEASIVRIAQLGRAAGIHLIVATQRPSADVVTGLIKANIDNRVALSVDNGMNSRIILDQMGAEKLLGNGDMLVKLRGKKPKRVQGCYVSDPEIEEAVSFIRDQGEPEYHDEILSAVSPSPVSTGAQELDEDDDPLLWEAAQIVVDSQLGSTSGLQRRLKVGYARAGRIMDMLEHKGVVGPPDGSKPRDVLLDAAGLEELKSADALYREV